MHAAAAQIPSNTSILQAVCHKCQYVGLEAGVRSCPLCSFPLIVEVGERDRHIDIVAMFDRTSVSIGAPPLPGVDDRPRKAQLLAEARKRRAAERRSQQMIAARRRPSTVRQIARHPRVRVGVAMFSALVAGFMAALLNAGM